MEVKDETQIPIPRGLDRLYCKVVRNEKEVERSFSDLSREEQRKHLEALDVEELKKVCFELSDTVRIIAEFFRFSCFYDEE